MVEGLADRAKAARGAAFAVLMGGAAEKCGLTDGAARIRGKFGGFVGVFSFEDVVVL